MKSVLRVVRAYGARNSLMTTEKYIKAKITPDTIANLCRLSFHHISCHCVAI